MKRISKKDENNQHLIDLCCLTHSTRTYLSRLAGCKKPEGGFPLNACLSTEITLTETILQKEHESPEQLKFPHFETFFIKHSTLE